MDEIVSFGSWLKQQRRALDLTQEALGRRAGCAAATIKKFEQEERRPSREMAERLAEALELGPEDRAAFVKSARGRLAAHRLQTASGPAGDNPHMHRPATNLPVERDPLIGRKREVAQVQELLLREDVGLVTLTGAGGIGKTRLALQVAAELLPHFADGVFFVDLSPIGDASLVAATIAGTLGVREPAGQSLIDTVTAYLRDKQILLVLDNFEQVVTAAAFVGRLLRSAPRLKLLVTSRMPLHLSCEHEYAVPPLALPDLAPLPQPDDLTECPAVALFLQRAKQVKPDFRVIQANAGAVAQICHRLDGLPLAIELAAARSKLFAPKALLARLRHPLTLLTGASRDLPARQQALRATLDWSYHLLSPSEQQLFTRLAVFVGGWTLEAAETVCNATRDLGVSVLDGLASLLDQHLLRQELGVDGEPRFRRLETIREYAREQLESSDEVEPLRRRHAVYYLELAETAARESARGAQQVVWMHQLVEERDNLRAAQQWILDQHEVALGLRLGSALLDFWIIRGHVTEGRHWLEAVLALSSSITLASAPPERLLALRAKALHSAGWLAHHQRDHVRAEALLAESLALARAMDDKLQILAVLRDLGAIRYYPGEGQCAVSLLEETVALSRELGDHRSEIIAHGFLGGFWRQQGDLIRAASSLEAALRISREIGYPEGIGWAGSYLARVATDQGDYRRATRLLVESLDQFQALGHMVGIAHTMEGYGCIAAVRGQADRAVRLFGAANALRAESNVPTTVTDEQLDVIPSLAAIQTQLDEALWEAAWAEGRAMTPERAIAYALQAGD